MPCFERMIGILLLGSLAGCGMMPDVSSMMPGSSTGSSAPYADPAAQIATIPRPPDALAIFAASAAPGQQGSVGGETARFTRAYNAASGRECREILLGYGANERSAVACRNEDGSYASARPLLRGSPR